MTTAGPQENNSEVLFAEGSHFSCCIESINGTLWLTWNGSKLLNSSSSVMMISSPDCVNISLQSTPLLGRLCCVATDDEDMSTLSKCINIVDRKGTELQRTELFSAMGYITSLPYFNPISSVRGSLEGCTTLHCPTWW